MNSNTGMNSMNYGNMNMQATGVANNANKMGGFGGFGMGAVGDDPFADIES